jgi:CheY-like chemotaxis protein
MEVRIAAMDTPQAVVSMSGQLIECNESFALICGFKEKLADTMNLSSLAKFSNPIEMLESLHILSVLDSSQDWKVALGQQNPSLTHLDYEIIVRLSDKKIGNENVLNATIQETQFSERRSKSRATSFSGTTSSSNSFHLDSSSRSEYGSLSEKSLMAAMCRASASMSLNESARSRLVHNVLIVEDSPSALKMMARMVKSLGHEVSTAVDGSEALEMLRHGTFDIVLMDINMPKMNGLEASNEFRKIETSNRNAAFGRGDYTITPPLKLFAISGDISSTILCEVMNAGFDGFVPKPLREESFLELLRTVEKK